MISFLIEPFAYGYMTKAMFISAMVGGLCAFSIGLSDAEGLVINR